jgi:hypothetical protein
MIRTAGETAENDRELYWTENVAAEGKWCSVGGPFSGF